MSWGINQVKRNYQSDYEYKKKLDDFKKRQSNRLKEETKNIPPIVDMSAAYSDVRKSNETIPQSVLSATSSRRI